MSTLIFGDSPFMNYKHANFSYDLCLNIVNYRREVFYLVNNFITNNGDNKYFIINLNDMISNFHKNISNNMNKCNKIIQYLSKNEIEKFNNIKFIVKNVNTDLEQDTLDEIISKLNVNEIYFNGCFGMKINDNINLNYPNIRKVLYYDTPCIPFNDFNEKLINAFDEIITFNIKYNEQMNKCFNKKTHYLKYNFQLPNKFDFSLYPTNENEFINKKYINRIKYNIPLNKVIFLVDIDGYDIALQEVKLLDLYFRLIEKLNKEFPNKYHFIFNVPNDFIFQNIYKIFDSKRKEKFDINGCCSFIHEYYHMEGYFWKYQYSDLVMTCDGVICLSGFELNHNASYIANMFNIPVFFNNNNDYLNTEISNGYSLETNLPLFVANKIQSFIKYPPLNYLYEHFLLFLNDKIKGNKYFFNKDFIPNYNEYYSGICNIINYK